ncbi:MAG: hypothetical protein KatS3mg110_1215 [Pirellulaceae bacterium]|nr:MAG: hypothetical protein KatS3mg110_1215 [Pirellulaceae bacterium]
MPCATSRRLTLAGLALLGIGLGIGTTLWTQQTQRKPRVAPRPFSAGESRDVFFDNVFDALIGSRPSGGASSITKAPAESPGSSGGSPTPPPAASGPWPQLISAETLEKEIKAIKARLDQTISTPSDFAGRGYKVARVQYSVLAMLFAIIHDYPGSVRWKADAAGARDAFARTAANCKVGSSQAFNEAKQRRSELDDLIRGNSFPQKAQTPENDWSTICDRSPLMIRLQTGYDLLKRAVADANSLAQQRDDVRSEAELMAAIAEVLCQPGMEDSADTTYTGFARKLQSEARRVIEAVKTNNYEQAREATGQIDQACSLCHESYRG